MDVVDSTEMTARELVTYAGQQAVDLEPVLDDIIFQKDGRSVFFWKKDSSVHYNMQGRVKSLPAGFEGSSGAFRGMWHEVGFVDGVAEAYALLKAWLLDAVEVDDLPPRSVRQHGVG
jgi:hypothetical protein